MGYTLNYANRGLTYKRMCLHGLFSAVTHPPFSSIILIRLLGAVAVAEQLQIEKIYELNLYTCNTSPGVQCRLHPITLIILI